jgi:hypothetical protein
MDALSDVLRAVRLTGAVFFDVRASEPWVAESPPGGSIVGSIFPGADHLMSYHVVTRGACWGGVLDEPALRLSAGDVILFPHGDAHAMSSARHAQRAGDVDLSSAHRRAAAVHDLHALPSARSGSRRLWVPGL